MPRLIIEVVADASNLERTLRRTATSAKRFEAQISGVGKSITRGLAVAGLGFFSARGLIEGLETSVEAASNLNEQMSAGQVVFGRSASALTSWSRKAATSIGLARDEAMQAAASFGGLAKAAGLTGDEAVTQVEKLIQRGADLASLYNTSVQDALDAIRSGIVGESEPLRRYNVFLSEASTTQEALRETGKRSADQLTQQEKAFARMTLVMRGSNVAAGNFAQTSGGLANQLRIFHANVRNLQIELGETLLPNLTKVVSKFNEWLDNPKNKQRVIDDWTTGITLLGTAADKTGKFFGTLAEAGDSLGKTLYDAFDWVRGGDFKRAMQVLDAIQRVQASQAARGPTGLRGPVGNPFGLAGPIGQPGLTGPGALTGPPQGTTGSGTAGMKPRQLAKLRMEAAIRSNTWFDNMIDRLLGRANDPESLRAQISNYRTIAGLLTQRLAVTKDITRRLRLQDEIADIAILIRDRRQQISDKAKSDRADRLNEQFGWLQFAAERAEATKTITDDVRAQRAIEKWLLGRIRHEGRTLELVSELWRTRQKIKDLNKKNLDADPLAGLMQVSSKRMANLLGAGLGLNAAGLGRLQANIAGQEIHNYVYMDGRQVAHSVNRANAQTGHRTSRQTSGFRG